MEDGRMYHLNQSDAIVWSEWTACCWNAQVGDRHLKSWEKFDSVPACSEVGALLPLGGVCCVPEGQGCRLGISKKQSHQQHC